jgi:hypothetical protein
MTVLDDLGKDVLESENLTVVSLLAYLTCHLFTANLLIAKIFLLHELHLLERTHSQQISKCLGSQLCLISNQFVDAVETDDPQSQSGHSEPAIINASQLRQQVLNESFEFFGKLDRF